MDLIEEYLHNNYEVDRTIRQNRSHLKDFFVKFIDTPAEEYVKSKRDYDKDFKDYANHIKYQAPCTRSNKLNTLKNFLMFQRIILDPLIIKATTGNLRRKVKTLDIIPTQQILKKILSHGNIRDRALFLFLSSSGCRIREVLQLEKSDIPAFKEMQRNERITFPIKVYIPATITKTGMPRITFISSETWESLLEWEKEKPEYLEFANKKTYRKNKKNDDRLIFPFGYTTAQQSWNRLLRKSGYDERDKSTDIHQRHIHTLRVYFKNRLIAAGIQERYIETMLGHVGYVQGAYDKYPVETLAEAYAKGEPQLLIFEQPQDLSEVNESLQQKEEKISKMEREMELMKQKIHLLELDKKVNDITNGNKKK